MLFTAVYLNLFGGNLTSLEGNTFARTIGTVIGQTPAPPTPKITNVLAQERAKQIERLTALTGRAEMASGAVSSLHLIAVAFEGVKPDDVGTQVFPRQSVYEDGYRRLTLDVSPALHDAVVMISDQPIRWTTVGLRPGSWPRLAFEGIAPFDIVDGQKGSLAGFRIAAFGATNVMRAIDPTKGEVSIPRHSAPRCRPGPITSPSHSATCGSRCCSIRRA